MDDIPTLTDMLAPATRSSPVPEPQAPAPTLKREEPADDSPCEDFLQFFWHVEQLRQRLFEKFGYKVSRRIENFSDGSSCVKLICPAYGKGEPGSQPKQVTLTVTTNSTQWQMNVGLSYLRDAMAFFIRRQEMSAVANDVISQLTTEQREALRWTLSELR